MSDDEKKITEKITHALVRLDENHETAFDVMKEEGFTMVNIDLDADQQPYALFVRNDIAFKEIKEYFVVYTFGSKMFNKVIKQHPVEYISKLKKESPDYALVFYKEIYQELEDIENLRF